jgi:hypothetical protein
MEDSPERDGQSWRRDFENVPHRKSDCGEYSGKNSKPRPFPMTQFEFISIAKNCPWNVKYLQNGIRLNCSNGTRRYLQVYTASWIVETKLPDHPNGKLEQRKWCYPSRQELIWMITEVTAPGRGLRTHTFTGYHKKENDFGYLKSCLHEKPYGHYAECGAYICVTCGGEIK